MHHAWSIICTSSSIDTRTNNLSLFNVIERISFNIDPEQEDQARQQEERGLLPLPINLEIVSTWWRSNLEQPESGVSLLTLITPDNETIELGTAQVDLESHTKVRNLGGLQGVPFTVNGLYYFEISQKVDNVWESVAKIPVELIKEEQT